MNFLKITAAAASLLAALCIGFPSHAADQCIPQGAFPSNWLLLQEAAGGHTIARHVGLSDAQLVDRLRNDPRIRSASSYTNLTVAESAITGALRGAAAAINGWAVKAKPGATRVDDFRPAAVVVGRQADRPPSLAKVTDRHSFRTIVRATGAGGCFLLTSYPS